MVCFSLLAWSSTFKEHVSRYRTTYDCDSNHPISTDLGVLSLIQGSLYSILPFLDIIIYHCCCCCYKTLNNISLSSHGLIYQLGWLFPTYTHTHRFPALPQYLLMAFSQTSAWKFSSPLPGAQTCHFYRGSLKRASCPAWAPGKYSKLSGVQQGPTAARSYLEAIFGSQESLQISWDLSGPTNHQGKFRSLERSPHLCRNF